MPIERVSADNKLWEALLRQWETTCASFGENLEDYAPASLSTLRPLAEQSQVASAGVYALRSESDYIGVCQLNAAFLPGYEGKVLRVRHIVHSPSYDFDNARTIDDYIDFLALLFSGVLNVSDEEMPAPHVKFHFSSPAERAFFDQFKGSLNSHGVFQDVTLRGSWLYLTKQVYNLDHERKR